MPGDAVPAITLTDPQNEAGLPSPAQSPQTPRKSASFELNSSNGAKARAGGPGSGSGGNGNASEGGLSMSSPVCVIAFLLVLVSAQARSFSSIALDMQGMSG